MNFEILTKHLTQTAYEAGRAIMNIYNQEISFEVKSDNSPVTEADHAAEAIILKDLEKIAPEIPVIAEESVQAGKIPDISKTERFFLVDPLDGTKEFIHKRGEFTVNIALIEKGKPSFGLVYAPALQELYYTEASNKAILAKLDCMDESFELKEQKAIQTKDVDDNGYIVVMSRSHLNDETKEFLKDYKVADSTSAGSSLKFCLLAKGQAHLYPRLARTMEWDTAAGHAVLKAAGGCVLRENKEPLNYGKSEDDFANPGFIAWAKPPIS